MDDTAHDRADDALKTAVKMAAETLMAKGIRPSLALIEAEVDGPRPKLTALLEEWAKAMGAREAADNSPARASVSPNQRNQRALESARAARVAGQNAAHARENSKREDAIAEVRLEIERAHERVRSMQLSMSDAPSKDSRDTSIEKMKLRIAGLEGVLAELQQRHPK
jgi:hypothetical protein